MPRATAFYGVLLCTALSLLVCCSAYGDSKGIINLDHLTFDKIIGEDRPVVVAFTDVQPYGEEWDAFTEAAVQSWTAHILFAQVTLGVQEDEYGYGGYGGGSQENENDKIAKRLRAEPGDVLFFAARQRTPTKWASEGKDKSDLLKWIKSHGVYVGLEGCVEEFDQFAEKFMAQEGDRVAILQLAEDEVKKLKEKDDEEHQSKVAQAVIYTSVMKKVLKNGGTYIQSEKDRLKKMIGDESVKEEKKDQFRKKLNILETFEPSPPEEPDQIDFDEDEDERAPKDEV
mmetsp:Transcript_129701/g.193065  ORF Transcript_129701/g.193065 Transcript_129701/m.193065 type:complete len:285 (+) Transcript_129701:16-870(+)